MTGKANKMKGDTFGAFDILVKLSAEKLPYSVSISGKEFEVLPGVYSPKYFEDTQLFANNLPNLKNKSVLEVGSGVGVISVLVALSGAKRVLAVDINQEAVKNTKLNIEKHNLVKVVEARWSDVYSGLDPIEKFDVILWNTPFIWSEKKELTDIQKSICDPEYGATKRFVSEADSHLLPGGKMYICFSMSVGRMDLLEKFVTKATMEWRLFKKIKSESESSLSYEIFEVKRVGE